MKLEFNVTEVEGKTLLYGNSWRQAVLSGPICGCKDSRMKRCAHRELSAVDYWTGEAAEEGIVEAAAPAALRVASLGSALAAGPGLPGV